MNMLPQQQATAGHDYENIAIPRDFFRFRFCNPAERKSQIPEF